MKKLLITITVVFAVLSCNKEKETIPTQPTSLNTITITNDLKRDIALYLFNSVKYATLKPIVKTLDWSKAMLFTDSGKRIIIPLKKSLYMKTSTSNTYVSEFL